MSDYVKVEGQIKELKSELQEMKKLLNQMIEVNDGRNSS